MKEDCVKRNVKERKICSNIPVLKKSKTRNNGMETGEINYQMINEENVR